MGGQLSVDNVHVVIVGGGFGGIAAGQRLKSNGIPFTLIDLRNAFHHNVAALRASVQSGFARQTFIPFEETFGTSFRQGRVVQVDPKAQVVVLEGGEEIHYSHLILCTGTDGPFPGKFNAVADYHTAIQKYEDLVKEIQAAASLVVIGGGSTGVEMAAEIKTDYPDKKVVLVHSHVALADPELLPSVRQQAKEVLLEKGVELVLGQKVSNLSDLELNVTRKNTTVMTDKGTEIITDIVISCTGNKINSAAYSSSLVTGWVTDRSHVDQPQFRSAQVRDTLRANQRKFFTFLFRDGCVRYPGGCLAKDGALKVNPQLQVEGFENIYAVGDCADVREPKMAYHAGLHAAVAVTNIINSLSGKAPTSYKPGSVTMLLAMGRNDGVGQFSGVRLARCLVTQGKSRGLLLWKSWREMGQRAPTEAA